MNHQTSPPLEPPFKEQGNESPLLHLDAWGRREAWCVQSLFHGKPTLICDHRLLMSDFTIQLQRGNSFHE